MILEKALKLESEELDVDVKGAKRKPKAFKDIL